MQNISLAFDNLCNMLKITKWNTKWQWNHFIALILRPWQPSWNPWKLIFSLKTKLASQEPSNCTEPGHGDAPWRPFWSLEAQSSALPKSVLSALIPKSFKKRFLPHLPTKNHTFDPARGLAKQVFGVGYGHVIPCIDKNNTGYTKIFIFAPKSTTGGR